MGRILVIAVASVAAVFGVLVLLQVTRRCVVEGTLIETPGGRRRVESLQAGDPVLSVGADGQRIDATVVAIHKGTAAHCKRLSVRGGETLAVTSTHPVATTRGWRAAGHLAVNDVVHTAAGFLPIDKIENAFGLVTVYDLTVEPGETFIAAGIVVHNKSYRDNDSTTRGDLRTMASLQAAYAQENGGHYGRLQCLAEPASCGAAWSHPNPPLPRNFLEAQRGGYRFDFRPGPEVSPSRITTFAYVAVPIKVGVTGQRGFCLDDTGRICVTTDGTAPPTAGGRCAPAWCKDLE